MEIFCIVYYITSYVSCIPQIIKINRTRSSNDLSLLETALSFIGCVLDYSHILYRAICGCICGYYNRFTYVNSIGYFHSKILQV